MRRWLIAYDISDPKRLARVHRCLAEAATPVQYSVFVGSFDEKRRRSLQVKLERRIDPTHDDVRFYGLGGCPHVRRDGPAPLPSGVHLFDDAPDLPTGTL